MRADLKALSPPGIRAGRRLFASRDLSTVAFGCFNVMKLEFRLWR